MSGDSSQGLNPSGGPWPALSDSQWLRLFFAPSRTGGDGPPQRQAGVGFFGGSRRPGSAPPDCEASPWTHQAIDATLRDIPLPPGLAERVLRGFEPEPPCG